MSDAIISVENLSKRYMVGHQAVSRERYTTLRDSIVREARSFARKAADLARGQQVVQGNDVEEFWALRNVSFEVRQGEVIGIIGHNGAGKSTLLKILTRITEPTEGRITMRGRVASLLEVGTGFHQELTGRENIFLNGAILGMTQAEIRQRFDEIVDFAGVEQFLDTPVKRYSSGMYVRLAFAVAAHLDPEILIIDEVLAVGDQEFQKKSVGKMRQVSSDLGRTVLFVSHNMTAVSALCQRSFLLEQGKLIAVGPTDEILRRYYEMNQGGSKEDIRVKTPHLQWLGLRNREALNQLRSDRDLVFQLQFKSGQEKLDDLEFDIALIDESERMVVHCRSRFLGETFSIAANSSFTVSYAVRAPRLAPGNYRLTVYATNNNAEICWVEQIDACSISAASPFVPDTLLVHVRGTMVPDFSVDVAPAG